MNAWMVPYPSVMYLLCRRVTFTASLFMYLQAWALENVVVPMARLYDLEEEYQYLRPSIKRFPKGKEQVRMAISAGFSKAVHYEIGFGLMGVLVATSR